MKSAVSTKLLFFIKIALRHECSPAHLQHIFRTQFPKNTSGGLLVIHLYSILSLLHPWRRIFPTNTPRGFHVETIWKRPFPRRFNVESM